MNEKKISKVMTIVYLILAACLIFGIILFTQDSQAGTSITVDGFMGPMTVQVSMNEGKIEGAKVTRSTDGEFLPQSADTIISQAVSKGNANGIDIVAGATTTSKALISALQQAYIVANTDETSLVGYGEGYKGPLSVVVTMEGDTIASAELLTISDSEFSTPTAFAVLEQAVVLGNAENLDVIAGATATSTGVITALKDAVSKK